jgi:outer membrane protein
MKQIKTLLIAAIFILANQTINAQAKDSSCCDVRNYGKMPAMLDAQKQLEKLSGTYDPTIKMVEE